MFFFKQKTAYEMRISDWSSDVCSSDLIEQSGETHWRATVQILDPRHTERRDRVRAWYGCTSLDEAGSLRQAVQYEIDAAQRKLDTEAGKPEVRPFYSGSNNGDAANRFQGVAAAAPSQPRSSGASVDGIAGLGASLYRSRAPRGRAEENTSARQALM